ncbi:MAG: peptide chain release factor 1 [Bacillota bacterium]|nr:peptide chain release factor 1 [Bacillota bacterium]
MNGKLKGILERYEELTNKLSQPDAMADMEAWQQMLKEHSALAEIAAKNTKYEAAAREVAELAEALQSGDEELAAIACEELPGAEKKAEVLKEELLVMLIPRNPDDDRNVVIEVRAGTGGEEAALFAADLLRMYMRFAERQGLEYELLSINETEKGGLKEAVAMIRGRGAYSRLKYESGVHRVQRVPETEASGRIHTSAATVAVLPEAEDVDVQIDPEELQIDTYRSGGAGGQHVNKTESAVRITHLPTGIVVQCQDERSQGRNKEKAMKVLKTRLFDMMQAKQRQEYASERRSQVGSGDRSERIRTYNFPQGRVTDHRIGMTIYSLEEFLDGDIAEMTGALVLADRKERLQNSDT